MNPINWDDPYGLRSRRTGYSAPPPGTMTVIGAMIGTLIGGAMGGGGGTLVCSPGGITALGCGGVGVMKGAAIGARIGATIGAAIDALILASAASDGNCGKFTCIATCQVIPHDGSSAWYINGPPGYGNSKSQACQNAKKLAQNSSPPHSHTRHCQCKKQNCWRR